VVVEDDPGLRGDLIEYLASRGFEALGAEDGQALDDILAEGGADLALLDIMLPGGESGIEIAKRLRRDGKIGIVMLTGLSAAQTHIDGLDAGADAYLVKTSELGVIEATIRSVLRRLELDLEIELAKTKSRAQSEAAWQIDELTWTLNAPNSRSAKLTSAETSILGELFKTLGHPVSRDALVRALGKPDSESNRRNLDVAIRRLRVKVESQIGLPLPLDTVYSRGYAFTAPGLLVAS
jgi:two-component system OmpR family response regulator